MANKEETPYHLKVKELMDGRTNRWLNKKTGIAESEISRILSGRLKPTESQVEKINWVFGTDFKVELP